jgi:hypothetical protein
MYDVLSNDIQAGNILALGGNSTAVDFNEAMQRTIRKYDSNVLVCIVRVEVCQQQQQQQDQ